ncbi:hypothetical protein LZL87_014249 [Fusarium oxysporum]|nr:hypothetical protein LZL87_014249 [Fusarium oxysporum]
MEVVTVPVPADTSAGPLRSLEHAIEDFQTILTDDQRRKLSSIGSIKDPDTVRIFTAQLDRENQLNKGRGIAGRLSSVLQSVQTFSAIIETFVSSNPNIAALVWGSVKLAMLIAVNYTSYFESLSVIFMGLSNQCPRFAEYQALYKTSTRLQKALCDFHASIICCWQKQLKAALFTSFEQEIESDVSDIRRMGKIAEDEINLAKAQADHQDQMLQEKERAAASKQRSRLRKFIPRVEGELDTIKELQMQRSTLKERHRLLKFLSSHDYEAPFREARKKHQYGTAEWILATPEFLRWYKGTGSALLWCSGKNQKHFVPLQDWEILLRQTIKASGIFLIFIDGLDEQDAPERRALLDALRSLTTTISALRIFITGRDSVSIDLKSRFSHIEHVPMSPVALASDIHNYVETSLQERIQNQDLVLHDPSLLRDIEETLTRHADGMFLWVMFLIDEVCAGSCDGDIKQSLHSLPKDLGETFARALSRIMSRQKKSELVQRVFRWVAVAKRPLTLDEIREAVSIDIGQPYLKTERLVRELTPIVMWSENLLQVTEDQPPTIEFAHSTICEFITKGDLPIQLSNFHVDVYEADHFAGEICITYLHLNDFKTAVARRPQPLLVNPMAIAGSVINKGPKTRKITSLVADFLRQSTVKTDLDLAGTLTSYNRADGIDKHQQGHSFLRKDLKLGICGIKLSQMAMIWRMHLGEAHYYTKRRKTQCFSGVINSIIMLSCDMLLAL